MYINVQSDIRTLQQAACRAQGCEWTPNIRHCWKKWPTKYMERIFGVPQSLLMPLGQCFSFNFAVALLSQHQSYINVWNTETENQCTAALCSLVHMCCDSVAGFRVTQIKHDCFQPAFGGLQRHHTLLPAPSYMLPRLGKTFIKKHIVKLHKNEYSHKNQTDAAYN